MSPDVCPICREFELEGMLLTSADGNSQGDCRHCGKYLISGSALHLVTNLSTKHADKRPLISHTVRRLSFGNDRPLLTSDLLNDILLNREFPTPQVQAEYLIHWLGKYGPSPGTLLCVTVEEHGAILGIQDINALHFVVDGLMKEELLKRYKTPDVATLAFAGWERYEALERGNSSGNKKAFMAMKFNEPEMDRMLEDCFRPAVDQTGFSLEKLDDNPKAGLIDDRMRVEIRLSRFLIADLSHANHGAYWEAGYAEGLGKPVIYMCKKSVFENTDTKPHFDTNHHLTIVWDESDLDKATEDLKATIRATITEARMEDG